MDRLRKPFHFLKKKKKKIRSSNGQPAASTPPATIVDDTGGSTPVVAAGTSSASSGGKLGDKVGQTDTPVSVQIPSSEKERIGLFELSKSDTVKAVDVVAVHGLQGDAYKTWTHENHTLWLRDMLPTEVPSARIMTFGYESAWAFSNSVAGIEHKARDLLNRLSAKRNDDTYRRPIVFICHSLGGIVVKKALILAHQKSSDFHDILTNTKAIAFLAVPHKGSGAAWWGNFAANVLKGASVGLSTNSALLADLRKDSSALTDIQKQSIERIQDLKMYTFYETLKLQNVLVGNRFDVGKETCI